jgi:trehalose 6-phosphate phosphatase
MITVDPQCDDQHCVNRLLEQIEHIEATALVIEDMTVLKSTEDKMNTTAADPTLSLESFDAFVFDLDGVITKTAKLHAAAWKTIFDDFLAKRATGGEQFVPFTTEADYLEYVDGKPRYDGVRSFLESRGIDLPDGNPDDLSSQDTVCGLGNRKDELYQQKLHSNGVEVYDSTITLLRTLRQAGIRIAVVSSSRSCQDVLEAAGIVDLFDARVDGVELDRLKMAGKPAPDMFLEASRRLDSDPLRCVGVEDATAGVQAAKAAGFGCVIGVNRGNQANALYEHGANIVVADLGELQVVRRSGNSPSPGQLPSALDCLDEILREDVREPALFLDYDGTLSPIVAHPDDAILSDTMRATLQRLTGLCAVAIVSGRDLGDVRERVGIEGIWYAGSHGFDIAGPAGERTEYEQGREYLPVLDAAEQTLRERLAAVPGCLVERKHFSIATHYRLVAQDEVATVKQAVVRTHADHPELRLTTGKKVLELQPDVDWDKGKALRWLMQVLDLEATRFIPVYIGDDVTDEDAFRELETDGAGILVAQEDGPTRARYRLDDTDAVERFLNRLGDKLLKSRS